MWETKKFQFLTLFIKCYEDYLTWDEGVLDRRQLKLYYRDIISVSGGSGAKHLGGTSRFEINTHGQTYTYDSTLGAFNGLEECMDIINERIDFFRKKKEEEDRQALVETVAKTIPTQSSLNININPENIEPTLTRIEIFLEDKEWDKAKAYSETALDYFPTDYRLYLYSLLADTESSTLEQLKYAKESFSSNGNYVKCTKYADESTIKTLNEALEYCEKEPIYQKALKSRKDKTYAINLLSTIPDYKDAAEQIERLKLERERENRKREKKESKKRKEEARKLKEKRDRELEENYQKAIQLQSDTNNLDDNKKALELFLALKNDRYKDSIERYQEVETRVSELERKSKYDTAVSLLNNARAQDAMKAKDLFEELSQDEPYKDSEMLAAKAQESYVELKRKTRRKLTTIAVVSVALIIGSIVAYAVGQNIKRSRAYEQAITLYENGDYDAAKEQFDELEGYKDSVSYSQKCEIEIKVEKERAEKYRRAEQEYNEGYFDEAIEIYAELGDYSDSKEKKEEAEEAIKSLEPIKKLIKEGKLSKAKAALEKSNLPETALEDYWEVVNEYGNYTGTFVFESGKADVLTKGKRVKKITITVQGIDINKHGKPVPGNTSLIIKYDGGSAKLGRNEVAGRYEREYKKNTYTSCPKYCYFRDGKSGSANLSAYDEVLTRSYSEHYSDTEVGERIVIEDCTRGNDEDYTGVYKRAKE